MSLFVGERPSDLAMRLKVSLKDGRLAGRSLFQALIECGIDPKSCRYINLFHDDRDEVKPARLKLIRRLAKTMVVVALGRKVEARIGIPHRFIVHPGARGSIRRKDRYAAHVRSVLFPMETRMTIQLLMVAQYGYHRAYVGAYCDRQPDGEMIYHTEYRHEGYRTEQGGIADAVRFLPGDRVRVIHKATAFALTVIEVKRSAQAVLESVAEVS
jgi:hypothetical protein